MNMLNLVMGNFHHFNAGALKRAFIDYYKLVVKNNGKMYLAMAGAMSSAQLGISLAEAIRRGLIHGMSTTGANLEESMFRLVADQEYKVFPNYRYHSLADEAEILAQDRRRVTDLAIPEEEAFRKVEGYLIQIWQKAGADGIRRFWHEFFYELVLKPELASEFQGKPEDCWLLEAARMNLPLLVGGFADSTSGNIFSAYCASNTERDPRIAKSDIEQFVNFYDVYQLLSEGEGVGFFQIGGGISGDLPICVVPSIKFDLKKDVKPWAYFAQISDSVTSYGGYSGATPNEKVTWGKVTPDTPMHVIESDATIVFPIILQCLFEAQDDQELADRLIAEYEADLAYRLFQPRKPVLD